MAPSPLSLVGHLHVPGGGTKPELLGRAGLGGQPEASPTPPPPPPASPTAGGSGRMGGIFFQPGPQLHPGGFHAVLPQRREQSWQLSTFP